MATQQIMWTTLPNGFASNGRLRLSVHVSPRLGPTLAQGTLAEFPDVLLWPSTLGGVTWRVEFQNSARLIDAVVVTSPPADVTRWAALFSGATPVDAWRFPDMTQRRVHSFPRSTIAGMVRDTYQRAATQSPEAFPSVMDLSPVRNQLGWDRQHGVAQQVEADLSTNKAIPPRPADVAYDFARFRGYHTPRARRTPGPADAPTLPRFDVHAMWALLQDHPSLLRLLGLVIDLELLEFPTGGTTAVRVRPQWTPQTSGTVDICPFTRCEVVPGTFAALSLATGETQDGYLKLEDSARYDVDAFDVDGAGLKLMDLAMLLDKAEEKRSLDTPDRFALASLRATGLGVYRKDRAHHLRERRWLRGRALDAQLLTGPSPGANVLLDADDLVQGARFDVQNSSAGPVAPWRSLVSRSTTYAFTTAPGLQDTVPLDEAIVAEAGTSAPGSGLTDDLVLGESVMLWDGWTLGAPRPGKVVANDDRVHPPDNPPQGGLPLVIAHRAVPGSLERLRFGTSYRFRARAVDLAGNSLPPGDASGAHATQPVFFGRYEPIASPPVLRRKPSTPGDTAERLVLRSNFDTMAVPATDERHLVAPKVAQLTCERHGSFDGMSAAAAYALITSREAKVLEDVPGAQPDPRDGGTFFVDADTVEAPYLPDPLALGVTLQGLSPTGGDVTVRYEGGWPELQAVRLVIEEAMVGDPGSFTVDGRGVVRVRLPKAARRRVKVSSLPDGARLLAVSGLWQWLSQAGSVTPALTTLVTGGRHWMFTPWRELELVHAVKQPLAPAVFTTLVAQRKVGETFATLDGVATFHRASTARVDLEASWVEVQDEGPGGPPPSRLDEAGTAYLDTRTASAVVSIPVGEPLRDAPNAETHFLLREVPSPGARHTFQDTRCRDVDYLARSFSAFDDFFRVTRVVDFGSGGTQVLDSSGVVRGTVRLEGLPGEPRASWTEGVDFTVDAAAGTVTRVEGSVMPGRLQASWVPKPNDRLAPAAVRVAVPASARPMAPLVKYVVPTFSEVSTGTGLRRTRTRTGGGLRIYLERPWWSSGKGELLGVVMHGAPSPGQAALDGDAARVCTQWGVDPVHLSAPTPDSVQPAAFPLRTETGTGLAVPEAAGVPLVVAGHRVAFDAERDLWYCDLQVDAGDAYAPFIRLALARYQPQSIPGQELSAVVLADFVQLPAGRTASIAPSDTQPIGGGEVVNVSVSGPTFDASPVDPRPPRVTVTVQRRSASIPGELGWDDVGQPVELEVTRARGSANFATGAVTLPSNVARGELRLLLREYERLRDDGRPADGPQSWAERPVWAEFIELG